MSIIPVEQVRLLKNELAAYKDDLTQSFMVVCNKIDLLESDAYLSGFSKSIQKELKIPEKDIFFISPATGQGTQEL